MPDIDWDDIQLEHAALVLGPAIKLGLIGGGLPPDEKTEMEAPIPT